MSDLILSKLFQPYFSKLGFERKTSPSLYKNEGMYFEPDPNLCEGFHWIFPVAKSYILNVQYLLFKESVSLNFGYADFISIGSYCNLLTGENALRGYIGYDGHCRIGIDKEVRFSNISINFLPEYYNHFLPERFDITTEEIRSTIRKFSGNIKIPEIETVFNELRFSRPSRRSAGMFYESRILDILSKIQNWRERQSAEERYPVGKTGLEEMVFVDEYLRKNFSNQISLGTISNSAYMSRSKLTRLFREAYGMSVIERLQNIRIERAKELLLNSDLDIGRISNMVGYKQHASFTNLFKRTTGLNPCDFRKRHRFV